MAEAVVMPALEMAQETGVLVRWLKREGEEVAKGDPIMEVETDKTTVEIESPAAGVLGGVLAQEGDVVPVGQTIAWVLRPGENVPVDQSHTAGSGPSGRARSFGKNGNGRSSVSPPGETARSRGEAVESGSSSAHPAGSVAVTPLARNIAEENGIDLSRISARGKRIEKADVLAYMREQGRAPAGEGAGRLQPASPKARRIARELGVDLAGIDGSGPEGAVLAADVESPRGGASYETPSSMWLRMAQRMSESWASVPHFYLVREVDAGPLVEWREHVSAEVEERSGARLTLSDLLVKCVAQTLRAHPRMNASWDDGSIRLNREINVGLAVALDSGLVVPVIRRADSVSLAELASRRTELVSRARGRKLTSEEMADGGFTITNLGMYNVDAFNAIVNPPQAAILAVGRIADRVVPVDGKPEIRPVMVLTLSCDHRTVDGARAARFLDDLARTIEDPWRLLI